MRGKMAKFSLDTLVLYAELLGLRTEIKTTETKRQGRTLGTAVGVSGAR